MWGVSVILAAVLLASCGTGLSPVEETAQEGIAPDRVPIILVPGVSREVGAQLRGGRLVPLNALALRTDSDALANLGDPRFSPDGARPLEAPTRLDRALRETEVRGLQGLIDSLVRDHGYVRGNPDQPVDKEYPENPAAARADRTRMASLYVLYYDWRRDLPENACLLAHRLARLRAWTGHDRLHVVGHSLGGVLVRYIARYGGRDAIGDRDCPLGDGKIREAVNLPGVGAIDRLVTLGAPHRGSAQAFRALMQDFSLFGFVSVGLRDAVFTMPMAWQLLPFAGGDGQVPILFGSAGPERVALFEPRTWIERGWLSGNGSDAEQRRFAGAMLGRATALHRLLAERSPREDAVRLMAVGSGCRPTTALALLENGKVDFLTRGQTDHPLFDRVTAPGDGVVTLESALGLPAAPTVTPVTVCSSHSGYMDDPSLRDRIVSFLLR
jgi:hypothetical protein